MKHLTIVVPDGQSNLSTIASIVGTYEIFTVANKYRRDTGKDDLFTITLAGVTDRTEVYGGLFAVSPQVNIQAITKTDLIIVPSLVRDYEKAMNGNEIIIKWVEQQYKKGAEIASICTGAFMLAAAGLLDGKSCATHWSAQNTFTNMFPKVNLQNDKLITDEHGICTNGGAYSFLNLVIYLIEKHYDRQTAIYCSKIFQIEMDRQSQSAFTIFTGQKTHDDEVVQKAQAYIETRLDEKISIEQLSSMFAVGRRNFDRRFIKATGNTPLEYAQRVKIESAKKTLETSRKTINEVMYDVGYNDVKAFRELFKKITGMSPLEYRGKYNREAMVL
jgi:transcriptional regulator GlxA family with amidase domain